MKRPLAIDLFGCGGGMLFGMQRAGFDVVATCDHDPRWAWTIKANFCGEHRLVREATSPIIATVNLYRANPKNLMDTWRVPPLSIRWCHASPPCQTHSIAQGRRWNTRDHRLLIAVVLWAAACPNAYITVENVVGVEKSRYFRKLLKALRALGRETCVHVVDATWYGVPQKRRRVWVISAPSNRPCPPLPLATRDPAEPRTWAWSMANPCPIEEVDDFRILKLPSWKQAILAQTPREQSSKQITHRGWRSYLDRRFNDPLKNFIRRLRVNAPVPAVLTSPCIGRMAIHCHPWLNRLSTLREMARFQSFPDEFILPVNLHDAYRMVGEAVPPLMAEAFGREILKASMEGRLIRGLAELSKRKGSPPRDWPDEYKDLLPRIQQQFLNDIA